MIRQAARSLARTPGFTIVAVLSLALAIGAAAAAFSVLDAVRFRALPFPNGERLVLLSELPVDDVAGGGAPSRSGEGGRDCRAACDVSYETFDQVLRNHPFKSLDAVAAYTTGGKALVTRGEPVAVLGGVISPNVFALLDAQPLLGRPFSAEDDRLGAVPVTIVSHALWTSQLGADSAILGRVVKLSDTEYTVIGVMPPGFRFESRSQFWLPIVPVLDPSTRPSIRTVTAVGRLAPGRTLEQLRGELATLQPAAPAGRPGGAPPPRMRLAAAPLRERYVASTQSHDLIFGGVVACVLLIACANLANLVLVRTLQQRHELAIRVALGSGTRTARHLLLQHAIVVVAGALLGVALAASSLGLLQSASALDSLRPPGMEYRLDARAIVFVVALAAAVTALLGAVPARLVTRIDAQRLLRDGGAGGGGRWGRRVQQLFVVAQVASAVVLLAGAGLMARSVVHLSELDLGFDARRVVQASPSYPHPWRVPEKYLPVTERIHDLLAALPGVEGAAIRASIPIGARGETPVVTVQGAASPLPALDAPSVAFAVSPSYFDVLGVRVVRGRPFEDTDRAGGIQVAMVNEWAARRWFPGEDPVGRTVRVDTAPSLGVTLTVVGVVDDNRAAQPEVLLAEDGAELYRPWNQANSPFPSFVVRAAAAPAPLLRPVRELLVREVPDRPVGASLLADEVSDQLRGVRTNALQILAFAAAGLLLALLGVYGVLAYTVGVRTREIGIRAALGASARRLHRMVLRDALALTVSGVALGIVAAMVATPLVAGLLHGTTARDPLVLSAVAAAVTVVSLVAGWLPARRAARVDPVVALQHG